MLRRLRSSGSILPPQSCSSLQCVSMQYPFGTLIVKLRFNKWRRYRRRQPAGPAGGCATLVVLAMSCNGKVHPIWTHCKHNSNSLLKAYAQVKLTCGSYVLQSVRAKFNQFQVSKLCPLCREEDETMQHFILHCSELESTRASFISALCDLVVCEDNEELLGLILDPSTACTSEENSDSGETQIFSLARGLCYALHVQRNTLLASV